ncbi:hypothetical protein Nepgr_023453 [Nepenthes gracilis]|uniref:Response regulatory domain-containing protein n=1 Tax=Nepenthes gracilis TaxID=150966 RepID=A0AAD3T2W0_NEPGR|nr:hypothetical protein Nepgr_023453 [Nepenthes gracilis]
MQSRNFSREISIDRKILEKLLTGSSYQVTCVESGDKALEYLGLLDNPPDPIHHDSLAPSSSSSTAAAAASATTTTTTSSSSSSSSSGSSHQQANGMRVNLIMTDYSMPGMSGYDLLKRVKGSSWKDVPVIIMSSENVPSRIDMCMEGGAEEFLLKPVQMADLKRLQPHLLKNSSSYGKRKAPMSKHSDRRIKFEFEGLAV